MSEIKLCKFHEKCEYFDEDSKTCTLYGGGDNCGKYREFCKKKLNINDLNQEIDELTLQTLKFQDPKQCELIKKRIISLNDLKLMLQKEGKIPKLFNKPEIEVI